MHHTQGNREASGTIKSATAEPNHGLIKPHCTIMHIVIAGKCAWVDSARFARV